VIELCELVAFFSTPFDDILATLPMPFGLGPTTGIGLLEDVPILAPPGLLLRSRIALPFSPIRDDDADNGGLYPDSESEAESQASSEASVHSDDVCVILGFFEPMGVLESVDMRGG
jgi:hypothetical protein